MKSLGLGQLSEPHSQYHLAVADGSPLATDARERALQPIRYREMVLTVGSRDVILNEYPNLPRFEAR